MLPALSLAPLTLAAVLALSGIAKLPDPGATASMIRLLRLPALPAGPVSRLLPWAELGTAALLLTPWRWTYAVGAVSATVLFVGFLLVVLRAMTFDPRPTCGCFGRVGDHRINGRTVARNSVLVGLAGVALGVALAGSSTGALVAAFTAGDWLWLLLALAMAAVSVFILGGGPQPARSTRRRRAARDDGAAGAGAATDGAPEQRASQEPSELDYVREPIPTGVLVDAELRTTSLRALARGQAQLLVLVNCWCGPTFEALDRLPRWRERLPELGVQLVHTHAPWDEPRASDLPGIWWDPGSQVYSALGAGPSPAAVLLGADGLLAGGPVDGIDAVETFVDDIAAELAEAAPPSHP